MDKKQCDKIFGYLFGIYIVTSYVGTIITIRMILENLGTNVHVGHYVMAGVYVAVSPFTFLFVVAYYLGKLVGIGI